MAISPHFKLTHYRNLIRQFMPYKTYIIRICECRPLRDQLFVRISGQLFLGAITYELLGDHIGQQAQVPVPDIADPHDLFVPAFLRR